LAGNPVTTRYYAGAYEKETASTVTKQIHYIMGGTGLVAVYIKWPNTLKDTLYYICKDRQGSITALVRQDKSEAEKFSYDAWGRRRNPNNWANFNVKTPRLISRGYTGHEMLDAFGLINMNGRMYDPAIGRVLSPDNYVQDATNTQCYNRYSYCMNNPLRFTDPSGWVALANVDNALFNISNAWAERINNPESYLYTSGYMGGGGGGGGGWGGIGGVVPGGIYNSWSSIAVNSNVDNVNFWGQLVGSIKYIPDGTYLLAASGMNNNGIYSFAFINKDYIERQQQYKKNDALAAASNIGYGKRFNDPGDSDVDPPGKNGYIFSIANGAIAFGPCGIMADLGIVSDSYGKVSPYLILGGVGGFGATFGFGGARTSKNFHLADFEGFSQGLSLTLFFGISAETFGNSSNSRGMAGIGDKYSGSGLNFGPGFMYGYNYSYTFLFSAPSSDFWVRPGRH